MIYPLCKSSLLRFTRQMENLALRMSWFFVVSVSAAALGPLLGACLIHVANESCAYHLADAPRCVLNSGSYILQHHSVNFVSMTALLVVCIMP